MRFRALPHFPEVHRRKVKARKDRIFFLDGFAGSRGPKKDFRTPCGMHGLFRLWSYILGSRPSQPFRGGAAPHEIISRLLDAKKHGGGKRPPAQGITGKISVARRS